jgi:hypothetical protein
MTTPDPTLWEVTLSGPTSFGPSSVLQSLLPWNQPKWRKVTIQMRVGSEECPDWDHVNLCMTGIQELITMADGLLSDDVLGALQAHLTVIEVETLKGPPRA